MEPVDYVRGIRRRWKVILASVIVAVVIGLIFSGGGSTPAPSTQATYRATIYLLSSTSGAAVGRAPSSLATVATIATLGEVPSRVADALPFEMTGAQVANVVTVNPDDTTGLLGIVARAPTAARARVIANTYAKELQGFLRDRTLQQAQTIQDQIDRLDRRIAAQNGGSSGGSSAAGAANKGGAAATTSGESSLELQRSFLAQQYSQLVASTGGDASGLEILAPAQSSLVPPDVGIEAPRSRWIRLLIAVGVGLLFGIGLALILERFDTKIRSKDQAEKVLHLPVLGEIPAASRRTKESITGEGFPSGPTANAFRFLAAALQLGRSEATPMGSSNGHHGTKTILVTSALPSEGKSTTVSNLALAYAELGKRVIVLCSDYRHPTLHDTLGVESGPGLTEALQGEPGGVERLLQPTSFEFIRVLSTGTDPYRAGMFGSEQMSNVLKSLRAATDVVLIDTAPLLFESDWSQMLPDIDALLLVVRAGKTDTATVARAAEMLAIIHAPVVGVALNGLPLSSVKTTAYRYRSGQRRADQVQGSNGSIGVPGEDSVEYDQDEQGEDASQDGGTVAGVGEPA